MTASQDAIVHAIDSFVTNALTLHTLSAVTDMASSIGGALFKIPLAKLYGT